MTAERIADEAQHALERGDTDRAESLLFEALGQARQEARRDLEIRVGCSLGELLINTGEPDQGLALLDHVLELCVDRKGFEPQRRVAQRYVAELRPVDDPHLVEWGD